MFFQNVTHSLSICYMLVIGVPVLLPPSLAGEGWGGGSFAHLNISKPALLPCPVTTGYQQSEPANVVDVGWG